MKVSAEEVELVFPGLVCLFTEKYMKGMNAAWINFNAAFILACFEHSSKAASVLKDIIAAAADRENGG